MAKKWTKKEEIIKRAELIRLYVKENKTIGEIAKILKCGESTVYDRLVRLNIPSLRSKKPKYNNIRQDIVIPKKYSRELAEFIGILLGDGHLNPTQVTITLGKKDKYYIDYIIGLINKIFNIKPKIIILAGGDYVIYFGSTVAVRWLVGMGLMFNKTKGQVDVPRWIFFQKSFIKRALRGLFDTDGSVYKLKHGAQISFCNQSVPLLKSARFMLLKLGFHPSKISGYNIYLTRKGDLKKFFNEIEFKNKKHIDRFLRFMRASHSGNCTWL